MPKIVCAVTIDTEPDCSPNWARSLPLRFDSINIGIKKILPVIFNKLEVKPTFFISPEVLQDKESVKTLTKLENCEFGTHLHGEYIEPEVKYKNPAGTRSNQYPCFDIKDKIEFEKIKNLDKLIQSKLGVKSISFRAARFGADLNTVHSLIKLGYKIDSSVTPHINWCLQHGPNFADFPEQPYLVDSNDFSKEDPDSSFLEIPLTIGGKRLPFLPKKWLFYRWLRPSHMMVFEEKILIEDYLRRYQNKKVIVFNMMFHSMELITKASPYSRTEIETRFFRHRLEKTLLYLKKLNCEFLTLKEIYHLIKKHHE